jgi:hypothetical protein
MGVVEMETTLEKPLVLVADDGSGRVWVVNDGEGKSWYKAGADAGWVPIKEAKGIPLALDLAYNFASHDPRWHPEVAAMLLTLKALSKFL